MNKLKDFFYNKNDIIVVLIIVLVAGFIIYTRIDAIMAYPEKLAEKTAQQQKEDAETSNTSEVQTETTASDNSAAGEKISITISDSDSSDTVSAKLYEAGLVSSDSEFEKYINDKGKSGALKSGTFQIPKGSSSEEILTIITN